MSIQSDNFVAVAGATKLRRKRPVGRPTKRKNGKAYSGAERSKNWRRKEKIREQQRKYGLPTDMSQQVMEWYTPPDIIQAAHRVMGKIDVDPTSCELAQTVVRAKIFHTVDDNGLKHPWHGTIWLNPPYTRGFIALFVDKLITEINAGHATQAILLTRGGTDTKWFHRAATAAQAVCFPSRIKFWSADRKIKTSLMTQVILYFGNKPEKFQKQFSQFGFVRMFV
jgi:ParB family chromosome partitioning protein